MKLTSQTIKDLARSVGIDRVGIVRAENLPTEEAQFREWLAKGYQASMAWIEREPEKRADPRILFPGCRSVIAVALNYYTPHEHSTSDNKGKISRYAWGDDYHDVFREKLKALVDKMTEISPDIQTKICVDTTPFMDKAWAVRAGIGWLGKSSNLITTDLGSWVFLGAVLVDIELEYDDRVVADHCGSCTACIDACPTGAITEPYVVDAAKCISYATIELRDEKMPEEIAANLEGWLYGCDICQDVCPWNRFEKPTHETRFEPREMETSLSLERVANLEHDDYVVRFRKSAIKRAKLLGLKRNAKALATNTHRSETL
ncbi:MAG: tRNA epoxyqueuosine(34) reductase QueG [Acidobacteria bacterium ACB1]|nr:Epoxyqueuosine reductase [Pyrinomonadaceae bacterium]MCE7960894.1 tRNA epoxyqueuosine(34) reductase QueG [Acidobacteria bacterium ACB1]RIJ93984.1 MAG: tRNA epoxyqueuosine(34) reductase QueG [Acidobacteriota bacterium]